MPGERSIISREVETDIVIVSKRISYEDEIFMTDPRVGLIAGQSAETGVLAFFDYFTLMEMP